MTTHPTMNQERRKIFYENRTIHRRTDYADPEAGGERCSGHGAVPRARDRNDDLLQLAPQAWGHGRLANITDEVSGGGERSHQGDACGSQLAKRLAEGCVKKK